MLAVAVVALSAAAVFLSSGRVEAEGSSLSRGAEGWLAARRYLEERGCRVRLADRPLAAGALEGVLVVAFPWQSHRFDWSDTASALDAHLGRRGTVLLAVVDDELDANQSAVLEALGLEWRSLRGRPPLAPWRWRAFVAEQWALAGDEGEPSVEIGAPRGAPRAPDGARVLFRGKEGVPLVFSYSRSGGRVFVLPAAALANGRLARGGNADLLERLREELGSRWTFDEFHHGLTAATPVEAARTARFFDLLMAQLGFAYVMAVTALVRRFGPAWSEPAVIAGSTASFLIGLGALHHRRGHHAEAARLLARRAQEYDPRIAAPPPADRVADGAALMALGRAVARVQSRKGGDR